MDPNWRRRSIDDANWGFYASGGGRSDGGGGEEGGRGGHGMARPIELPTSADVSLLSSSTRMGMAGVGEFGKTLSPSKCRTCRIRE
jgi:hypothetical protein